MVGMAEQKEERLQICHLRAMELSNSGVFLILDFLFCELINKLLV
jgi:hypothetical protein